MGLAFGLDSTAFIAFSHAIMDLKEGGNFTAIFESDDYEVRNQDELSQLPRTRCAIALTLD